MQRLTVIISILHETMIFHKFDKVSKKIIISDMRCCVKNNNKIFCR